MKIEEFNKFELEALTTALELNIRDDWGKWTEEDKKIARGIVRKIEEEEPNSVSKTILKLVES